jgi:hypothetical protein
MTTSLSLPLLSSVIADAAARGLVLRMRVPFAPLFTPLEAAPRSSQRIGLSDSLDLARVSREVSRNAIFSCVLGDGVWQCIPALSPYGPEGHVMLIETRTNRYLPTAELIPDGEGDELLRLASSILVETTRLYGDGTINVGYNASPLGHGKEEEEFGGMQSIATKFHLQLWGWPPEPDFCGEAQYNDYRASWIPISQLSEAQRSILIANDYGVEFGKLLANAIRRDLAGRAPGPSRLLDIERWTYDARGIVAPFDCSVLELISSPSFFHLTLKPMAASLSASLQRLTEAFVRMDCDRMTETLRRCELGPLSPEEMAGIRAVPEMRPVDEIRAAFLRKGWPAALLEQFLPMVQARCAPQPGQSQVPTWRKGFAYSIVFSGRVQGASGEMRIMPVAQLGPAGVVEAQGIVLERVRQSAPLSELRRKGHALHDLGLKLANLF